MKEFVKFFLIWYSQQMAIPFWVLGHVHLHFATYHDAWEYGASFLMHLYFFFCEILVADDAPRKQSL